MDIDALRSFIAFVDTGSFTRAAKQIHRSQSAISMQMKKLEQEVGSELFCRSGRQLQLTEQGQLLAGHARAILGRHDSALSELKGQSQLPPLRLGCPDDYAATTLVAVVSELQKLTPSIELQLSCNNSTSLRQQLDAGELDAAILTRAVDSDEGYLLCHDQGYWVHGGYPELLEASPLVLALYQSDCKFHRAATDGLEKHGKPYRLLCQSSSCTAIKSLLQEGLALAVLAGSSIDSGLVKVEQSQLPQLPSIDIVLALSSRPHPSLGPKTAGLISTKLCNSVI